MRKFLSHGVVMMAGVVSLPVSIATIVPRLRVTVEEVREGPRVEALDTRMESLKAFFQRAACPAAMYAEDFLQAADRHSLDWRLLPSISFLESGGGKEAINNNMFGWDSGRAKFASFQAGIHEVAHHLANSVLYRGKDLDGILATYNPNSEYAVQIKTVMRRIAPSE